MAISKELRKTTSKRRIQEVREDWINMFTLFCERLIDGDTNDEKLREKVEAASDLADLAIEKIEGRWGE